MALNCPETRLGLQGSFEFFKRVGQTMTLEEKLKKINIVDSESKLIPLKSGSKITIEDFWTFFIKPRLPDPKVVKAWSKLLINYTKEDDAVFVVRAFAGWCKKDREAKKDDELRRGFLTIPNNATYSYFFTDNSFAAYFHKMALDGFVPSLSEFKVMMKERRFPAHFGRCCSMERDKAAYKIGATPVPPIGQDGYKISHVSDAGKFYSLNGKDCFSITDLSKIYFPRGKYSNWEYNSKLGCYVRNLEVLPETRDILVAHFLRFINPFNHFLTPKAKHTHKNNTTGITTTTIYNKYFNFLKNEDGYDIGEFKPLIDYVNERFEEDIYKDEYIEYKKRLLLPDDFFGKVNGDEVINIEYGNPLHVFSVLKGVPLATATGVVSAPKIKTKTKTSTSRTRLNYTIELVPSDKDLFKSELLIKKQAKRTIIYRDGSVKAEVWDASSFSPSSNLGGNVSSQIWHRKDKDQIEKVVYEV